MIVEWVDPADLKPYVDLSAEDVAWIDAIIARVILTWGWEYDRAEAEARRAVIEFYERGEARQIEEALYQKRLAYEADTQRLQREAALHTDTENQRRQHIAWERAEDIEEQRRRRIAREQKWRKEQQDATARRNAKEHAKRLELERRQRDAWRSANGVADPPVDYSSWNFYDAMLESAREHDNDLIKGETVDIVNCWRAEIDASCSEVEYDAKYDIEPDKFSWDDLLLNDWDRHDNRT